MPASMTIDQAGLPAGVANQARTDGLATGALVTLESVGGGVTNRFELLWVPPEDTTAVSSLVSAGPTTWTFSPDPSCYGTYRILLVIDEGTPTESRQILAFVIRTPVQGLIIPAANEVADPTATLATAGTGTISRSEQNEPFAPFTLGSSWGWWRALRDALMAIDAGGGGGSNVLFEWNNADLTQLALSNPLPAPAIASGASNINSAIVTAPGNSATRLTLHVSADEIVNGASVWFFDALRPLDDYRQQIDWTIAYPLPGPAAASGELVFYGIVYAGDAASGILVYDVVHFQDDGAGNVIQKRQVVMVNPVDAVNFVLYESTIPGGYVIHCSTLLNVLRDDTVYAGAPGVPTGWGNLDSHAWVPATSAPPQAGGAAILFNSTFGPPGAAWATSGCNRIGVILGGAWTLATSGAQVGTIMDFLVTKVKP